MQFQDFSIGEPVQFGCHAGDLARAGHEYERVRSFVSFEGLRMSRRGRPGHVRQECGSHPAIVQALRPRGPFDVQRIQRGRAIHDGRGAISAQQFRET